MFYFLPVCFNRHIFYGYSALSTATAGFLFSAFSTICPAAADGIDMILKLPETFIINGVVLPFSFLVGGYQTAISQNLHMMGKRRLSDLQLFKKITATFLARGQHLNNAESVCIRHCFTDLEYLFSCHDFSPHIDLRLYIVYRIHRHLSI